MNFGQTALQVLKTVAPTLALAVGGPFGPLAAAAIHAALGTTDQASAEKALVNATPDQLLALKKADQDFEIQMEKLGIEKAKLVYDDIANARAREMSVKDFTPQVLAYGITLGFFGILGYLLWNGKPPGGDVIMVMLGALGSAWAGVISYYFGSSAGETGKSAAINKIAASK